jgi:hypothetical protein
MRVEDEQYPAPVFGVVLQHIGQLLQVLPENKKRLRIRAITLRLGREEALERARALARTEQDKLR